MADDRRPEQRRRRPGPCLAPRGDEPHARPNDAALTPHVGVAASHCPTVPRTRASPEPRTGPARRVTQAVNLARRGVDASRERVEHRRGAAPLEVIRRNEAHRAPCAPPAALELVVWAARGRQPAHPNRPPPLSSAQVRVHGVRAHLPAPALAPANAPELGLVGRSEFVSPRRRPNLDSCLAWKAGQGAPVGLLERAVQARPERPGCKNPAHAVR